MFKKQMAIRLLLSLIPVVLLSIMLDGVVAAQGGTTYFFESHGTKHSIWAVVRDGLVANLVFFLSAGMVITILTTRDPESQPFIQRLLAIFPKLQRHLDLTNPIVSLVKEDASFTTEARVRIRFTSYDHATQSYRIEVTKTERIISLLKDSEEYEDGDFQVVVDTDIVDGKEALGEVIAASLTPIRGTELAPKPAFDFTKGRNNKLTKERPKWSVDNETVVLPPGSDGWLSLEYWVTAAVACPFVTSMRRPARKIVVKLEGRLPESFDSSKKIHVRVFLRGEFGGRAWFSRRMSPTSGGCEVSFTPQRRRPAIQLDFREPLIYPSRPLP